MILAFVLVLSIIGIALSLSMYANLLPFVGTLGDIKQYNMAYYGAQSSLERSLLVLRYQDPGFDGEGGRIADIDIGPVSDGQPNFGLFSAPGNELYRQIKGRGSMVPFEGLGNVPVFFLSGSSNDYNILNYRAIDRIRLGYDSTTDERSYVRDNRYVYASGVSISVAARLNPTIYNEIYQSAGSANVCYAPGCDINGDGVDDDIALDRGRKGRYNDGTSSGLFSIFPYQSINYVNGVGTVRNDDQAVRESLLSINGSEVLRFGQGGQSFNPIGNSFGRADGSGHLVVTDNDSLSGLSFESFLNPATSPSIFGQELSLGLINPLITQQFFVYPFLEYHVDCNDCVDQDGEPQLSQPYFYITAQSKVGSYDVKMQLVRSAYSDSLISSFTVIF